MSSPLVEIEGLRQLRRSLRQAGDDMADLKAANAAAAATAAGGATPPERTGALAGSIRSTGTKTAGIIRAGRAAIPYAGPIHWGWPARNIPANPFLVDGAQRTEPTWLPVYEAHVNAILEKVQST